VHMQYTCSTALAIPCPTNTLPPAVAYLVYHGAPTENIRVTYGSVDVWRKVLSSVREWQDLELLYRIVE